MRLRHFTGLLLIASLGAAACSTTGSSTPNTNTSNDQRTRIAGPVVQTADASLPREARAVANNTSTVTLLDRMVEGISSTDFTYSRGERKIASPTLSRSAAGLKLEFIVDTCADGALKRKIDYSFSDKPDDPGASSIAIGGTAFIFAPDYPACVDGQFSATESFPPVAGQFLAVSVPS